MDTLSIYLFNIWALVELVLSQPELYLLSFAIWTFLFGGRDEEYLSESLGIQLSDR